jgi:hypothetical protein
MVQAKIVKEDLSGVARSLKNFLSKQVPPVSDKMLF